VAEVFLVTMALFWLREGFTSSSDARTFVVQSHRNLALVVLSSCQFWRADKGLEYVVVERKAEERTGL
jgi:hypothetical protein